MFDGQQHGACYGRRQEALVLLDPARGLRVVLHFLPGGAVIQKYLAGNMLDVQVNGQALGFTLYWPWVGNAGVYNAWNAGGGADGSSQETGGSIGTPKARPYSTSFAAFNSYSVSHQPACPSGSTYSILYMQTPPRPILYKETANSTAVPSPPQQDQARRVSRGSRLRWCCRGGSPTGPASRGCNRSASGPRRLSS